MRMIRLGVRNLLRSKWRLAVVALLIGVPFFLMLIMQSMADAVDRQTKQLQENVANTLQVRAEASMGHINMMGNDKLLPNDALFKARNTEHVVRVEPYILAMTPTEGHGFAMIVGIDPNDTRRLETHGEVGNPKIIAGRDLTDDDIGKPVAIMGQHFAKWAGITPETLGKVKYKLDPRRTHPVIYGMERPAVDLEIVGIYASGYVFGDQQLFMSEQTFRQIYGAQEGYSWLFVKAHTADHLPGVVKALKDKLGDGVDIAAPVSVAEFQTTTTQAVQRLAAGGTLLSTLLMAIVVFFVMLLIVRERAWEIGTFKALGASNGGITAGFLAEAVALCLAGAAIGTVLFVIWGGTVVQHVFSLGVAPFLPPHYKDTLISAVTLSTDVSPATLGLLAAGALVAAACGSLWSIRQIVKLSPVEAIRHG